MADKRFQTIYSQGTINAGRKGSARQFAREMTESGLVAAVRREEGNEGYAYFFPMEDEETVLLIDSWRVNGVGGGENGHPGSQKHIVPDGHGRNGC